MEPKHGSIHLHRAQRCSHHRLFTKLLRRLKNLLLALEKIAASGRKILFVATKKQAKDIVADKAASCKHALHHRKMAWRNVDQLHHHPKSRKENGSAIDRMKTDGSFERLVKKRAIANQPSKSKIRKEFRFYF